MALNLAKVALRQDQPEDNALSFSIASFKGLALNDHLLNLFIDLSELEPTLIKSHANFGNSSGQFFMSWRVKKNVGSLRVI